MGNRIITWVTAIVALGFLVSGFSIGIDPRTSIVLAVFSMTFPVWIILMLVLTVGCVVVKNRHGGLISLIAWIIGFYNVFSIMPFNVGASEHADDTTLKVMSYNVFRFWVGDSTDLSQGNPTLNSVINSGADIVVLQESIPIRPNKKLGIMAHQCDTLKQLYPYSNISGDGQALLSKYAFTTVSLPEKASGSAQFAAYSISLNDTLQLCLINVHLQSFRLNSAERKAYYEFTDGEVSKSSLKEARQKILPKVKKALRSHAEEAEMLVRNVDAVWPEGMLILCGDFNDITDSYPMKILCRDCRLNDAFRKASFGPMATYHVSRFYFNIDHILYRGLSTPIDYRRLKVPASDHYPVLATFVLN